MKKLWYAIALTAAAFLFGCSRSVEPEDVLTNREVLRSFIRGNPGIFSNSFLDTVLFDIDSSDLSFSRSFSIKTQDTFIIINTDDTLMQPSGPVLVPKNPADAGADIKDTMLVTLRSTDSLGPHNRTPSRIPIAKFAYFQRLNPQRINLGWVLWSVSQTFVGNPGIIDTVWIRASGSRKDTSIFRAPRDTAPETDPQLLRSQTNPFRLEADDSVEVKVQVRFSVEDTVYHLFCHVQDASPIRRVQLFPDSTRRLFSAKFKLSHPAGHHFLFTRLVVDALGENGLRNAALPLRNEIWGIVYQVVPPGTIP
jgi:hypothetical protein